MRKLLAAAQADQRDDAGGVDTVFQVGGRVLLRIKELLHAADIGKLRPRWEGPFTVTACPSPNAYTHALPRRMRCSPTVNVDRLKPFFERVGAPPAPGPVSDPEQEGEHEAKLLLNRRRVRGVARRRVRWRGDTSADDEWLREEEQLHRDKVAEYDAAAPSSCDSPGRTAVAAHRRAAAAAAAVTTSCRAALAVAPAGLSRWRRAPPCWTGRCYTTGPAMAGFVGRWRRAVGHRGFRTWSGTGLGRRWAPRWSTRCSMPPRTGRLAAGSCCARRASRPVALAGRL